MSKIFNLQNLTLFLGLCFGVLMWTCDANAATRVVTDDDKRLALLFVSEELMVVDSKEAAFNYYLDAQEDLMSGEAEPSLVLDMADTYRQRHPEEDAFAHAFAPTSKIIFERDNIWHVIDMSGDIKVAERCYTQRGQEVRCN